MARLVLKKQYTLSLNLSSPSSSPVFIITILLISATTSNAITNANNLFHLLLQSLNHNNVVHSPEIWRSPPSYSEV